jgi:hypothetical protein
MSAPQARPRTTHLLATLFVLASASLSAAAQRPAKTTVESQVLLAAEPGVQYAVSAKGQHVAAVALRGSRQVMVHDGVDGPRFDEILKLSTTTADKVQWSDDGNRFIYWGRVGQEYAVMVDGKEVHRGAWSAEAAARGQSPVFEMGFAPRSKHWYVILLNQNSSRQNYQLVIDGKPGPVSQSSIAPVWSLDGEHHAYIQQIFPITAPQPSLALIVDGKTAPYNAGEPQFTADGLHLFTKRMVPRASLTEVLANGQPFMRAESVQLHMSPTGPGVLGVVWSTAQNARVSFLTVGNRKVPGSECADNAGLSGIYISSDAKHFAAKCRTWIMADAKKGQEYADGVSNVAFTADGRAVYQALTNGKTFLIVGDQESDGYASIESETAVTRAQRLTSNFTPAPAVIRGNKVGYIARVAQSGNNFVVVVDGNKPLSAVNATHLTFSPDGSRFAFLAGHPYQNATVDGTAYSQMNVDGGVGNVGYQGTFQWSADNKHVAWIVGTPSQGVAIDGKYIATGGMTRFLKFTADGKRLVWLVLNPAAPRHLIFVDGVQVLDLPQNLPLENEADIYWSFPEDGSIVLVAQDGDAMKRFKITPGSETSVETVLAKAK